MNIVFDAVRRDLYSEYEAEIAEMVASLAPTQYLTEEELDEQQSVPEHLRFAYTKQQLLCLRAAKISPSSFRRAIHNEEAKKNEPAHLDEEKDKKKEFCGEVLGKMKGKDNKFWKEKEAEMLEREAILEKLIRFHQKDLLDKCYTNGEVGKLQMHRLQSEAVRLLRESILAQEAHRQAKRCLPRCVPISAEGSVKVGKEKEEHQQQQSQLGFPGSEGSAGKRFPENAAKCGGAASTPFVRQEDLPEMVDTDGGGKIRSYDLEVQNDGKELEREEAGEEQQCSHANAALEEGREAMPDAISDWVIHMDNWRTVKEGGHHGASYSTQRLNILDMLDRRLKEEELTRKVDALI